MYHCDLSIGLGGLLPEVRDVLTKVAPLEKFHHHYVILKGAADLNRENLNICIFDETFSMSLKTLKKLSAAGTRCILCTLAPAKVAAEVLDCLQGIWVKPLVPALLQFYVQRLQQQVKEEKEHWLCRNYLDTTINMVPDLIWYKDVRGAHLKVNDAFCKLVGKPREDIQGRGHYYVWGLTKEQYEQGEYVCLDTEETVLRKKKVCQFDEKVLSGKNLRDLLTYKAPIFAEDGSVMGTVGVAHDVTQEHKYQKQILDMARTDDLTGLANRRYFYSYLGRHRGKKRLTILYCDLDCFKELNDRCGHQAGDEALITVGRLLRRNFPHALVARVGGDEFLVAFIGSYSMESIMKKVELVQMRLRRVFDERTKFDGLSMSAGLAATDEPSASLDSLIHQSDMALYEAKRTGKGQCRIYTGNK